MMELLQLRTLTAAHPALSSKLGYFNSFR